MIAEQFARAPRLDPSGTSWLPAPFWIAGAALAVLGRSLASARVVACALGAVSVIAPYAAMRAARVPRATAWVATAVAAAIPWNAWLGVSTVPDGWTGALLAAGAIAMGARDDNRSHAPRAHAWGALALLVASLSRYEAWPVCALFAVRTAARALSPSRDATPGGSRRTDEIAWTLVAIAGPLAWMAWNAHAHGSPFHFVARVTAFRRAIGAAGVPLSEKLLGYPRALVLETPEVAVLGAFGLAGLAASRELRARWVWAAAAAAAVLSFLVAGDVGDGAPTHHPARALGSLWWILTGMGADALFAAAATARSKGVRASLQAGVPVATLVWCATLSPRWQEAPGQAPSERRDAQIARGLDLRARGVTGADVTPCSFEHFALIAAWAEPERANVAPRTGGEPTSACPRLTER